MDSAVSAAVLRGRPYGGVGILIRNNFLNLIKYSKCEKRFTIIVVNKVMLVSLYLPSVSDCVDLNIIMETLTEVESIIQQFPNSKIIWGGDLNAI